MRGLRFLLLMVVLVAAVAAFYVLAPFGPGAEVLVDVPPGTSTAAMAAALERAGVIRSRYAFEAVRKLEGGSLKAGTYRFDHPAPVTEVYARIRRGDVFTRTLVIPEGLNLFDVAAAVEAAKLGTAAEFLAAARAHTELIRQWSPGAESLEGYLFPDTYRFSPHATPVTMLTAMVKRFGQQAGTLGLVPRSVNSRDGLTAAQIVTMASLVEREVHVDAERPVVAGVFLNRLRAGMPLQTDPAVVYASLLRGTWTGVIHQSELHSDSAYNTYTHRGLPPGPICNPGIAALRAALHPTASEFVYFVANANGTTAFAKTLQEHEANVARMRAEAGQ